MNGYVTCNERFYSYWPRQFTYDFSYHIFAPFWADGDGRGGSVPCAKNEDSVVFYQFYENDVSINGVPSQTDADKMVLNAKTQLIIARAQADALQRDDEFEVSWVAVITWNKMRPYSYYNSANSVSNESNVIF